MSGTFLILEAEDGWGVSWGGPNPEAHDYISCANKHEAVAVRDALEAYVSSRIATDNVSVPRGLLWSLCCSAAELSTRIIAGGDGELGWLISKSSKRAQEILNAEATR